MIKSASTLKNETIEVINLVEDNFSLQVPHLLNLCQL